LEEPLGLGNGETGTPAVLEARKGSGENIRPGGRTAESSEIKADLKEPSTVVRPVPDDRGGLGPGSRLRGQVRCPPCLVQSTGDDPRLRSSEHVVI